MISDETSSRDGQSETFGVVAIGVSAGGLETLEQLFSSLPCDTGMAFVVIQHLSPDFKSMLSDLLGRKTQMSIETVGDAMELKPDTVYVMPAGKEMVISDGKFLLTDRDIRESLNLPIDHFFRSLAQDLGPRGIAVVMSGSGSDGSRGICEIHALGGLVFCQSPETAQFDGMPSSAIRSNVVDSVGSPQEIASMLVGVSNRKGPFADRVQAFRRLRSGEAIDAHHEDLFALLRDRFGVDFHGYKPSIIDRRITSRAQQWCDGDIERYKAGLETNPDQLNQLYQDLLICVTEFFRDEKSFADLSDGIEILLQDIPDGGTFRAWVAGCATGEEAYSLAILIDETARRLNRTIDIKIFGTDVFKASIDIAHAGVYSAEAIAKLSNERIDRYFRPSYEKYRVSTELRNRVVFAVHDLLKNPPFTQMHLISCRNLLIYFKHPTQKRVLSLLHFGLRNRGILFLGSSESLGDLESEFDCYHEKSKLYIKRRDVQLLSSFRSHHSGRILKTGRNDNSHLRNSDHELNIDLEAVLNGCLPPTLLVDENANLQRVFANAGEFLRPSDGAPSICLLDLITGDLRAAASAGIKRAMDTDSPVVIKSVSIDHHNESQINLKVTPVRRDHSHRRFAISFEKQSAEQNNQSIVGRSGSDESPAIPPNRIAQLEQELLETKRDLRAAIDESQTNFETVQSTNEELMAANEELQGANEELQSVNEELFTVNAELQGKIVELTEMSNDMEHLLLSTEVHTLFLDRDLRIRKFTPKITDVFHLVPEDIRRPIQSFAHNILCDDLLERLQEVASQGVASEDEVRDLSGNHFLMRILPYQESGLTNGVVMTLTNITELIISQKQALDAARRFERAVEASSDGIWDWPDTSSTQMWWSDSCYLLLGYQPGEIPSTFESWSYLIHPIDRRLISESANLSNGRCNMELHRDFDYRMRHKTGEYRWYRHRTLVDLDGEGRPVRMTGSLSDIHQRKRAELQASIEIQRRDKFLAMLSHELRNPLAAAQGAITLLKNNRSGKDQFAEHRLAEDDCCEFENRQQDAFVSTAVLEDDAAFESESIDVLDRHVSHMRRLLDDLLDVARIQQDKIDLKMEIVDLGHLSRQVLQSVQHEFAEYRQRLHVSIPTQPVYVLVDADRMTQAQVNLLVNASKYSDTDTDVYYEIDIEDNQAVITVRDHGQGITEEDLESIFELFFQADQSLDHPFGGMGVGLSLAKGIIEAHGGSITAASDGQGQGATMTIRLPLVVPPELSQDSAHHGPPRRHITMMKVIVVEDNVDVLRLTGRQLKQCGFEVACAADGYEALERIDDFQPKVALIDIGLPGISGFQLARKIRESRSGQSMLLIAVTGYGDKANRDEAKAAGFDHHLIKPLNIHEINRIVEEYELRHQLLQET